MKRSSDRPTFVSECVSGRRNWMGMDGWMDARHVGEIESSQVTY